MWAPDSDIWQYAYLNFEFPPLEGAQSPQGNVGLVCGTCSDSSPQGQALVAVSNERSAAVAAAGPIDSVLAELRVPTSAELPQHLANIVQVHGAVEVLAQLLKVCPREQLEDACQRVWATMRPDERFTMVRSCNACCRVAMCSAQDPMHRIAGRSR